MKLKITLFKNDHKKADNHPDYKGSALVDEKWVKNAVAGWVREKDGKKYISISVDTEYESVPVIQADAVEKKFNEISKPDYDDDAAKLAESIPF